MPSGEFHWDGAFPRNAVFQVKLLESALGLCRERLAVAYLPKFVVKMHNEMVKATHQITELPLPLDIPNSKS
jgi:DNA-binding transcriptional LysR family regulator